MPRTLCTLLVAAAALAPAARAAADNYALDASHTSIIFGVSHLGYSYTYGRFNKLTGSFVIDAANPAASNFQLTIDAASVDTNDAKRDEHLRGPDFFNVNQFPTLSFQSTAVEVTQAESGPVYNVTGNFTMHGTTKQITLPLKKLGEGNGPYGNYRTGFFCDYRLKRSDFGMSTMVPNIGDTIAITISFEGIRQGQPEGSGSANR